MALLEQVWLALLVSVSESAPFVLLGLFLAGLVREFVPASALEKQLGGAGVGPVLRSVGLGAAIPVCSCSTIPLGLGMARGGAGTGTALAFMTSAPAISPVTVILGLSLLGPALLGAYTVAVIIGSCLIGLIGNAVLQKWKDHSASSTSKEPCGCGCDNEVKSKGSRFVSSVRWAFFDLGSEVSLSLLLGLMVATIILVFTPSQWMQEIAANPGPMAILSVILLAIPTYTCSVPALIIASSLIAKGAHPSLAVAFLIAGPATNLGELNAIRVGLGLRAAGYYFLAVMLLAVGASTAVSYLSFPTPPSHASSVVNTHQDHGHLHFGDADEVAGQEAIKTTLVSLWRWPFVFAIGALAFHAAITKWFKKGSSYAGVKTIPKEKNLDASIVLLERSVSKGWPQ